jgi:hypothetical protein
MCGFVHQVKTERTYRNPLNPDSEVPPQNLVKGYRYGRDIVVVAPADAAMMKVDFLGFLMPPLTTLFDYYFFKFFF